MPVVPSDFEYQFSPSVLREVRERLGLSQSQIAKTLNLPVNTVSRWERGETSPDANSLAAIYSIAKRAGVEPDFFRKGGDMVNSTNRRQKPLNGRQVLNKQRTKLWLMWDFQNVPLKPDEAYDTWFYMEKFMAIAFPTVNDRDLKVYTSGQHQKAVEYLRNLEVSRSFYSNADSQIEQNIRRLCNHQSPSPWGFLNPGIDPKDTVLILVSKDGDFANVVQEAYQAGVDVYLWAPPGCSRNLLEAVRKQNIIPWSHPCRIVSEDNLKRLR